MASIQETLEHFTIKNLNIYEWYSVIELFAEFKRIKKIEINWVHSLNDDDLEEWKLILKQYKEAILWKHSQIDISIGYEEINF